MADDILQTTGHGASNLDARAQQTATPSHDHVRSSAYHATDPGQVVAAEEDEALGEVSDVTSTSSLRSSVFNYPIEHGRQYHAYKDGKYHRPNDESELDRLDLMHELFSVVNDGRLHLARIGETPQRILDIGAGSGIWCNEMGDRYPSAEIIGVDISANMPTQTAPNVSFEVDDVEEEWTYQRPFDYIHSRYMVGSIKDWAGYVKQCFEFTRPGGSVEFIDFDYWIYSQDGSLREDHALRRWDALTFDAAQRRGRMLNCGPRLGEWAREAGFVDIRVIKQPLPIGLWPKDKKMKRIGLFNWTQLWEGLQGMSLRLFTQWLGWEREELEVLIAEVRNDLKNPKIHAMYDMWTVCARKPTAI